MTSQPVETRTEHAVDGFFSGLAGLAILLFFLAPFYFLFRWIYRHIEKEWGCLVAGFVVALLVAGSWTAAYVWDQAQEAKAFAPTEITE